MAGYVGSSGAITLSGIAIGEVVAGGTPGSVLFVDGSGNLGQDNAKLFFDDTNFILKFPTEGEAIQMATVIQPFRILTGHYVSNATNDPYLAIGYNIAGGNASASNPITPGVEQLQIALEAKWNPSGTYTQVEFNHDYWSSDGLTHRRAFLHQLRNDTYVGTWDWFGDTFTWSNSQNNATFLTIDATSSTYTGSNISIGLVKATGTTNIINNSANPAFVLNCTGGAANNRLWDIFVSSNVMEFRLVNDAVNAAVDWMTVTRTANTADLITIRGTEVAFGTAAAVYTAQRAGIFEWSAASVVGWSSTSDPAGTLDIILQRDAPGILSMVNGGNAQTFRVWGHITGSKYISLSHDATDGILSTSSGDLKLSPAGSLSFGTFSALGIEIITGYITIKDSAGNSRKLAVIA